MPVSILFSHGCVTSPVKLRVGEISHAPSSESIRYALSSCNWFLRVIINWMLLILIPFLLITFLSPSPSWLTLSIWVVVCLCLSWRRLCVVISRQRSILPSISFFLLLMWSSMPRMYQWTPDECIPEFYCDPDTFISLHDNMSDIGMSFLARIIPRTPSLVSYSYRVHCLASSHAWVWLRFCSYSSLDRSQLWVFPLVLLLFTSYKLSGEAAIKAKNVPLKQETIKGLNKSPGFVQLFVYPHPQCIYTHDQQMIDLNILLEGQTEETKCILYTILFYRC